jgi:hypothetical protein
MLDIHGRWALDPCTHLLTIFLFKLIAIVAVASVVIDKVLARTTIAASLWATIVDVSADELCALVIEDKLISRQAVACVVLELVNARAEWSARVTYAIVNVLARRHWREVTVGQA